MPMYAPGYSSANMGLATNLLPIIGTMLMLSAPPAIIDSPMPAIICMAAVATVCKPLEQKRLMVWPQTLSGKPARNAAMRAIFIPCSASGKAQPRAISSTSPPSIPARSITALITAAARSSGRVVRKVPFGALPTAVRTAATITAFCMVNTPFSIGYTVS